MTDIRWKEITVEALSVTPPLLRRRMVVIVVWVEAQVAGHLRGL